MRVTGLRTDDQDGIRLFMKQNLLMTLTTFKTHDNNEWSEKSLQVLDEHEMQNTYGTASEHNSIFFNQNQGRKLNCGIDNDLETHEVFMFVISS